MNYKEEFEAIIERVYDLEDGQREKSRLIESAIKLAQRHQDRELEFEAKLLFMESTESTGENDKALTIYPWLLNYLDEQEKNGEESNYSKYSILWMYKWVIYTLPYYPNIPLARIDAAFKDMSDRYIREGHGERAVQEYRLIVARYLGQKEKTQTLWNELKENPDPGYSAMSDCPTCVRHDEVETYIFLEEYETAITHAKPLLKGKISCSSKPKDTYDHMLPVFIHLEQFDKAKKVAKKLLKAFKKARYRDTPVANVLLFHTLTGNFDEAILYLEKYLPRVQELIEQHTPFQHNLMAWRLFDEMQQAGHQEVAIVFPKKHPLYKSESTYPVATLLDWFKEETRVLAARFDKRNENSYYSALIQWHFDLKCFEL